MEPHELHEDFKEFLKSLNSSGVKYLLIGGYAVGFHGYPRTTADLDVWIATGPENAARVSQALHAFGFASGVSPQLFIQPDKVFRMGIPPVRIELLTSVSGLSFEEAYASRVSAEIDGIPVTLISLDDLKKNKKASGRHKDLSDLDHLP